MRHRALWSTVAVIAAVHVGLVLAVWWGLYPPAVARPAAAPTQSDAAVATPPSFAVQRLAELFSGAAFRSVITFNYAALNDLVRQAAAWPEVVYVSVEDGQGKVIAHTDPARIGQPWSSAVTRQTRGAYQEATASIVGPEVAGETGPGVGRVRLGYRAETPSAVVTPATRPVARLRVLAILLGLAALAAIPVGLALVKLGGLGAPAVDGPPVDLRKISSLRQARSTIAHWMRDADLLRTQLAAEREEVQRLRREVAQGASHLTEAAAESEQLLSDRASWLIERERLCAELTERDREIERARASVEERVSEAEAARQFLQAEVADLRDEVRQAHAALAGHPAVCRELLEQELRQHQHRAVAYISHAIRSSLTNVLGFSKLLLRVGNGPLTETQRTSVLNIQEAGNHLLDVVNDLSDLTQVEAGTLEPRDEVIDVAAALREVAATSMADLRRDPETVSVAWPPTLPPVRGNKRRLVQILLMLMHAPTRDADGPVELSAQADEESVSLIVTHRGAVVPVQDLPALFEPFSAIDATSTLQDDGRRLRLALARALLTTLGGSVAVDGQEGTGTTFTVTMPVVADVSAVA